MSDNGARSDRTNVVVERVLEAPVAEVWKAWSEPEYVQGWWGPDGFTAPLAEMDFRVGGTSLVCMSSPKFGEMYNTWHYHRIQPMQVIEFTLNFVDHERRILEPEEIGLSDVPRDVRHVINLRALGDNRTELTVTEYGYLSPQAAQISKLGLQQSLDKMATHLGS